MKYWCDNCQCIVEEDDIDEDIDRLVERVDEGGPMPSGEHNLEGCGALVYPLEVHQKQKRIRRRIDSLELRLNGLVKAASNAAMAREIRSLHRLAEKLSKDL